MRLVSKGSRVVVGGYGYFVLRPSLSVQRMYGNDDSWNTRRRVLCFLVSNAERQVRSTLVCVTDHYKKVYQIQFNLRFCLTLQLV